MNETYVTLQGWLGGPAALRRAGDTPVASFRVASTPRRLQRSTGAWVDGEVQWFTVTAWRSLAEHCARSLRRGDPVVVHGRLSHRTFVDGTGVERSSSEVEAVFVGHDLTRGTSTFTRAARPESPGGPEASRGPESSVPESPGETVETVETVEAAEGRAVDAA